MHSRVLTIGLIIGILVAVGFANGPAPASPQPAQSAASDAGHFPLPSDALVVQDATAGDLRLVDLLLEFSRVTGQNIVMSQSTRAQVEQVEVGLLGGVTVPEAEVYSFVEGLLFRHRFVLAEIRHSDPPLLAIYHPDSRDNVGHWVEVEEGRIADYANHHALCVQTMSNVWPLDARQVATSMRSMTSDSSRQRMLALSEHTLLMSGTGAEVAGWVELLKAAAASQQAIVEAQPGPEQTGQDGR
ncbi:MAG: hypothetical protein AAF682_30145 [Planctomycetota bacterium]